MTYGKRESLDFWLPFCPTEIKIYKSDIAFSAWAIDISFLMMYILNVKGLKKKPIQIYIEPRQNNVLEILSRKNGVSKAEIIRKSLEKFLHELPVEEDPAMGLIGLGGSGKGNLSDQHDKYVVRHAISKRKR